MLIEKFKNYENNENKNGTELCQYYSHEPHASKCAGLSKI